MKKILALSTLTLAIAACSQTSTPTAHTGPTVPGFTGPVYQDTQAAYDALALSTIGAQALSPQVYLNVLPVAKTDDSVRAYVKSTFASPVTCNLTFGDASAPVPFASPSTARIDTRDHAYSIFGTYTITATCTNNGTVVGTKSVTVQAGKKIISESTVIGFEDPATNGVNSYNTFNEKGFTFSANDGTGLVQISGTYPSNHHGPSQFLLPNNYGAGIEMVREDGQPFTLKSFEFSGWDGEFGGTVIGTRADGSIVAANEYTPTGEPTTLTLGAEWSGLVKVNFGSDMSNGNVQALDNINVVPERGLVSATSVR